MVKKIIPCFVLFAIVLSFCSPFAIADSSYNSSVTNFWDNMILENQLWADQGSSVGGLAPALGGFLGSKIWKNDSVCANSDSGLHETSNATTYGSGTDDYGPYVILKCDYCNTEFRCYGSDLQNAYTDYANSLPFSGYSSSGYYLWQATIDDISFSNSRFGGYNYFNISSIPYYYPDVDTTNNINYFHIYALNNTSLYIEGNSGTACFLRLIAPITGTYTLDDYIYVEYLMPWTGYRNASYRNRQCIGSYYCNMGNPLVEIQGYASNGTYSSITCASIYYLPVYKVVPVSTLDQSGILYTTIYAPTTRINNISFNFATVENNEITEVYEDITIINETNNTLYNPVTNESYEINNWNYDYTTRTYNGTLNVDPEVTFELAYNDDKVVLKIGDLEFDLNYVVEEEPEPTPTPDPEPINTPLPTDSDVDTDDTPYWLWLMDWLDNFKAWLGDKLDKLGGGDVNITYNDNSSDLQNYYDYEITYENSEGEEESFSFKKLFSKFRWIKDVWNIGQELVSVVSSDAAYAYEFNVAVLDYGQEAAEDDSGEESPIVDGNGELDDLETDGAGIIVNGAPSLTINLGAAQSYYGYSYGGTVEFLDLSWYTPYKSTVDGILSGFLWIFFVWKLFQKAPGIIGGAAMDSSKVEDIRNGERRR